MGEAIKTFVENALGMTDGVFGVEFDEMLISISSTILLFLVIRFFFWNKVTDYLEARRETMRNEYEAAKLANEEAQSLKDEAHGELHSLRLSSKKVIDDAKLRGEEERQAIIEKARQDAAKLVDNAQKEIDSNIEKARNSINEEIVSVATLMAEKIIKKELDENKHKELIKEVTKEVAN